MSTPLCLWERLEIALLHYSLREWPNEFPARVKTVLSWIMVVTAALGLLLAIAWLVLLLTTELGVVAHVVALVTPLVLGFTLATLVGEFAVSKIVDDVRFNIGNPAYSKPWLAEIRKTTRTDDDVAVLEEIITALEGGELSESLFRRAPPSLAGTSLVHELQRRVELSHKRVSRSRRRS